MALGRHLKRAIDVGLGALLLGLLSPVMLAVAAAILVTSGPPVLFRQRRPGLRGEPFELYKFRTMRHPAPGEATWTTDAARVTRLGTLLRRTSLDELPELVNVIAGTMSLVGPRPLLLEYLPRYRPRHRLRHEVKPGITGLAQVSGRRSLTLGQRLELDVEYVEHWSLRLDLAILLRTLAAPVRPGEIRGQTIAEIDDVQLIPIREATD